jgi:hypothetical protein
VTASNGYGSSPARSTPASEPVARNAPPVNTQLPALVGAPEIGATLHTTNGSWTNEPVSFDIRWLRCDERNCMAISQVVGDTYVVGESDAGYRIAVDVTAVAATGRSRTARSATVAVPRLPQAPPPPPPAPPPVPPLAPPLPSPPDEPPDPSWPGPAPVVDAPAADDSPASTDDDTSGPSTVTVTSAIARRGRLAATMPASVTRSTDRLSVPRHVTLNDLRRHGMGIQAICATTCVARVIVYVSTRHGRTAAAKTTRRVASAAHATFRVRFGVRGRRLLRTMRGRRLTVVGVLRDVAGRRTSTTSRTLVR